MFGAGGAGRSAGPAGGVGRSVGRAGGVGRSAGPPNRRWHMTCSKQRRTAREKARHDRSGAQWNMAGAVCHPGKTSGLVINGSSVGRNQ